MPVIPGNYDSVTITVNMDELNTAAQNIVGQCTIIGDYLTMINKTLSDLRLAWTGPAATDADEVNANWNNLMTELFGTQADPKTGILNILAGGVSTGVTNYASNDWGIASMFSTFYNAFPASSGNASNSPPPDTTQSVFDGSNFEPNPPYHDTAVNEVY